MVVTFSLVVALPLEVNWGNAPDVERTIFIYWEVVLLRLVAFEGCVCMVDGFFLILSDAVRC